MQNTILVTGGADFIGSNFILQRIQEEAASIVNLDKLTYAGNLRNLESVASASGYGLSTAISRTVSLSVDC